MRDEVAGCDMLAVRGVQGTKRSAAERITLLEPFLTLLSTRSRCADDRAGGPFLLLELLIDGKAKLRVSGVSAVLPAGIKGSDTITCFDNPTSDRRRALNCYL